ncbi:TPA: hypothetical protein EYP66_18570 [Candidatus Poribacteria bacterium]|nr:hypothetical protein [Candidatus Poribacteria bacterium]
MGLFQHLLLDCFCQQSAEVDFGLGANMKAEKVQVYWPKGANVFGCSGESGGGGSGKIKFNVQSVHRTDGRQ